MDTDDVSLAEVIFSQPNVLNRMHNMRFFSHENRFRNETSLSLNFRQFEKLLRNFEEKKDPPKRRQKAAFLTFS